VGIVKARSFDDRLDDGWLPCPWAVTQRPATSSARGSGAACAKRWPTGLVAASSDVNRSTLVAPRKRTVGQWRTTWLQEDQRPWVRAVTCDSYAMLVRRHRIPPRGHLPRKDVRPEHGQRRDNEKMQSGRTDGRGGLSGRAVRYLHAVLHGALQHALTKQRVVRKVTEAARRGHASHPPADPATGRSTPHRH
jgi:hypothetical protein